MPDDILDTWYNYYINNNEIYKANIIRYEIEIRKAPVKKINFKYLVSILSIILLLILKNIFLVIIISVFIYYVFKYISNLL